MRRQVAAEKQGKPRLRFVGETISELKKVVWPPRREATYLTTMVIVVSLAMALILWVVDYGFTELMNAVLLR